MNSEQQDAYLALPIIVEVIGATGVSADTKEHDVQIARAGVAALKR
jgi:uncharacterized protein GlcG (DUF336 family)